MRCLHLISGLALVASLSACRPAEKAVVAERPPQKVEVITLAPVELTDRLKVTGTLEANESIALQPEIAGIVRGIAFEEGAVVKKGQLLVQLDDAELNAQTREAEARAELARLNRSRAEALSADRTLAQSELDRARSEEMAATASLDLLRVRLARTRIESPFAGVLGSRRVAVGDYVTPSNVLTTLDDLSALKVDFQIPERSMDRVRNGSRVQVSARVGNAAEAIKAEGEVFFASRSIDPGSRAGRVRALLRDAPEGLRPGMFVTVELDLERRAGVLAAPESALLGGARGVQVIRVREEGGKHVVGPVRVSTGLRVGPLVEISAVAPDVLAAGDRIVVSGVGALALFPGAPVVPVAQNVPLRAIGSEEP